MRSHQGIRPYVCKKCDRTFSRYVVNPHAPVLASPVLYRPEHLTKHKLNHDLEQTALNDGAQAMLALSQHS